ncbi:alpha/beta fold hydrolase [Psychromonas ossibalaenae]|uniref:alpha/beta fold hydrolase n=1 Tax=Psychromonas ossibalaenae TaxID=444922 RepID=UPI000380D5C7|nr:alpha/beta hydrolase [Psychromonas ossibalaenae]
MPKLHSNGINLYYEIHGAGQPLLFIHGLGSSTCDWELQIEEFSRSYQVITFDLRGHGRSDKPAGPYTMSMLAADCIGLMQGLGVEKAHVVGLSLGGCIAFQLAIDAPQLVRTLTVINAVPELVAHTFKERLEIYLRLLIVSLFGMRKTGQILSRRLFIKPQQEKLRRTFTARWAENDQQAYLAALKAMIGWSVTARLAEIDCPVLIITSDQDYTPVAVKAAYTEKLSNAQLVVIADCRHALPVEQPLLLHSALTGFLVKQS